MDDYTYDNYDYGVYDTQTTQLTEAQSATFVGVICGFYIIVIILILIAVAGIWKMFVKANKPGWAAIVPFYNIIVMLEIIGRPLWWLVLCLIPVVNFVASIILSLDVAKAYGRGVGTGIGLIFLPYIFYPILGFGKATYVGPVAGTPTTSTPNNTNQNVTVS